MTYLTKEERQRALKHVRDCDKLFDGHYHNGVIRHDRQTAYAELRMLVFELMDKLER